MRYWSLVLALTSAAGAQSITGSLLGTVTDPSGAPVLGAQLRVLRESTNTESETKTDNRGNYEVPLLRPGTYRITAGAPGFQTLVRSGIELSVGGRVQVNLALQIGTAAESIVVTGRAELVESGTAALATTLGSRAIEELPLKGRYVLQFAALTPGVQVNPQAVNAGGGGLTNADFSVNGGRYRTNDLLVDGVSSSLPKNNDFGVMPLPEGVVEMKIHTNAYSAEFGRTGGGVFNVITRGGSNELHGSLFLFHQNDNLDANAWFANTRGQAKGNFRRNQFGGSMGGPVKRDKTFYYGDYQDTRASSAGSTGAATLPLAEFRQGDFRNLVNRNGQAITIFDPVTTTASGSGFVRTPFPGNAIPASRQDVAARNLMKLYPEPNRPGTGPARVDNFVFQQPSQSRSYQYTGRVDHEFSSFHRIFGRYTRSNGTSTALGDYGTLGDSVLGFNPGSVSQSAAINDTYTFTPTVLLNSRLGFSRDFSARTPLHEGINLAQFGFNPALDSIREENSLPGFRPAGYGGLGPQGGDRIRLANDIWHLNSDLTVIRGTHTIKMGGEGRLYNQNAYQAGSENAQFSFPVSWTQGPDPQRATLTAGDGIASFLLGTGGGSITSTPRLAVRNFYWGAFVNDDWKMSSRLTLNLGFRWEVETARTERYNRFATFDFTRPFPIPVPGLPGLRGTLTHPGQDGEPRGNMDNVWTNFGPRAGFAYRAGHGFVLRGGYGIFYSPVFGYTAPNSFGTSGALITTPWVGSLDGLRPLNYLSNPFPDGALRKSNDPVDVTQMGLGVIAMDRRNVNDIYTQQWNLNIQRQIAGNVLIEAAYAGNKGVRVPVGINWNQLDPRYQSLGPALAESVPNPFFGIVREGGLAQRTVTRGQLLRPYPHYGGVQTYMQNMGSSIYHSFTLKIEKRLSRGFLGQIAYTNGKLIDNGSGRVVNITDFVPPVQNAYDLRAERSISEGDVSQRLVLFGSWDLPWARQNRVIGGWSVSAWGTFHTGFPIGLISSGSPGVFSAVTRPNSTGRPGNKTGPTQSRLNEYFDTQAFRIPEPFTFGNVARTLPDTRGPGRAHTDVTLHKDFRVTERFRFRLRAEAYNLANTPFFDMPADNRGAANFGVISGARLQRTVQVSSRLVW